MNQPWTAQELQTEADFELALLGAGRLLEQDFKNNLAFRRSHPYIEPMGIEILDGLHPKAYLFLDRYRLLGVRTGLVSTSRSPLLLVQPRDRAQALKTALDFLTRPGGIRKIKWILSEGDRQAFEEWAQAPPPGIRWSASPNPYPDAVLKLPSDFEKFLAGSGYKFRRNVRHYFKVSENKNWSFRRNLERGAFQAAAAQLSRTSRFSHPRQRITGFFNKLSVIPGAFGAGLFDGENPLSVLGGWVLGPTAYILFQLNDTHRPEASLSMTLRSHLLRFFINEGIQRVVFLGGCSQPIHMLCNENPHLDLVILRPHWFWDTVENLDIRHFQKTMAWLRLDFTRWGPDQGGRAASLHPKVMDPPSGGLG